MCPYSSLLAAFGAPNIKWCEESLCAYVQEPANTWSNLAFILVGLWVHRSSGGRPSLRLLGAATIVMGILSLVYHASNTYATQVLDFVGMFLYLSLLWVWNLRRLGLLERAPLATAAYFGIVYVNMAMLLVFPWLLGQPIQLIIGVLTIALILSEVVLLSRTVRAHGLGPYRDYGLAMVCLFGAATASYLDLTRRWCEPSNHWLQGHATWHVLAAGSVIFVFRFYRALLADRPAGGRDFFPRAT